LRTPDERFKDLPDFPWTPRYREIDSGLGPKLRIASIDEGPANRDPVLLMHGEPSWSYLYRHMAPVFLASGARVVARGADRVKPIDRTTRAHRIACPHRRRLAARPADLP